MELHYSPLESARFGLRIFRGSADTLDHTALLAELREKKIDTAILRLPAKAIGDLVGLDRLGLTPIVADTLVHYARDLGGYQPRPVRNPTLELRRAGPADRALLDGMVRRIFDDYPNHYRANPLFSRQAILDGYAEWACQHIDTAATITWLVVVNGEPAGFSCCRIDNAAARAHGVLNGILPDASGRGYYRDMLRQMLAYFAGRQIKNFAISTQVHQLAVQRVWSDEGLRLCNAENTIHINALLGKPEI